MYACIIKKGDMDLLSKSMNCMYEVSWVGCLICYSWDLV